MAYSKTALLQTSAECTAGRLSSRYVRSLYSVYDPLNNTWPPHEYLEVSDTYIYVHICRYIYVIFLEVSAGHATVSGHTTSSP